MIDKIQHLTEILKTFALFGFWGIVSILIALILLASLRGLWSYVKEFMGWS